MFKLLSVCLCLILLFGCGANQKKANLIPAKVTLVISGQTVEAVLAETSQLVKVRIVGIDAPDLRQSPWGETAKERLNELVTDLPINLETDSLKRDRFNRIQAHIWQGKILVSQQLVKEGCVLANTEYPHSYSKLLIDAREYARLMGLGIWNPKLALRQTPSQFRQQIKNNHQLRSITNN